ncbi:MAG: ABC-F type ribosomal protection protein [Mollicutes bacterium]|nr:ABC-F type ribosomal protection protein [Mollicutes bacterium]
MKYQIINGAITFGNNTILEEINFTINKSDRIAIVGRNGSGKTSLLKSLVDNDMLESGIGFDDLRIVKIGKPSIGYQEQHAFSNLDVTLLDEILKVYKNITNLENKIKKLEDKMISNATSETILEYTDCIERYKLIGGYSYKKEYEVALNKFGFSSEDKMKKLSEFSGGQRTKISFLKLLLSKPDILLLDEPTNHLDIVTVEWLEEYLSNYPKALVVISHDRMFLDKIVNKVYEIEYATLTLYKGNYSSYELQKKLNYEKQLADYEFQQKEIKRLQDIADRFRYKPSKASMAMSKLRKIEQMTIIDKPEHADTRNWKFLLKVDDYSSNNVLSVKDLVIGYKNIPLSKVSFNLYKGQKLAIIGENGKGKSTLIKTLMGIIPKISGKFTYGYNVNKEYFDQQMEFLNDENTVFDEYLHSFPTEDPQQIRNILGTFMFSGEDVFKKIKVLSGGEKVRLQLCKILRKSPNLLILDEPTNHLDIFSKEKLETLLTEYNGTVLFVSHDRYFINKVADSLLVFENDEVVYFDGKYDEYVNQKKSIVITSEKAKDKKISKKESKPKTTFAIMKKLERDIDKKENKRKELETKLFDKEIYTNITKVNEINDMIENLTKEIENLYDEWENISE